MIKLVAIDLDGTMYNSNKEIPPEVKESIVRIQRAGIQATIITGRGIFGSEIAL